MMEDDQKLGDGIPEPSILHKRTGRPKGSRDRKRRTPKKRKKATTLAGAEKILDEAQNTLRRLGDAKFTSRKKRLIEVSGSTRFTRLACFEEAIKLIRDGYSIYDIARWIQEERHECLDINRKSLVIYIYQYMRDHMSNADLYGNRLPSLYQMLSESMKEILDGAKALSDLFHIQFDRMMIDYTQEKRLNRTHEQTTKNVMGCVEIAFKLEQIKNQLRTHGLKQSYQAAVTLNRASSLNAPSESTPPNESALDQRFDEIKMKISEKYGERFGNIAADPLKRRKLLSIFDRMTKIGDPKFVSILEKYREIDQQMQNVEIQTAAATAMTTESMTLTVKEESETMPPLPMLEQ